MGWIANAGTSDLLQCGPTFDGVYKTAMPVFITERERETLGRALTAMPYPYHDLLARVTIIIIIIIIGSSVFLIHSVLGTFCHILFLETPGAHPSALVQITEQSITILTLSASYSQGDRVKQLSCFLQQDRHSPSISSLSCITVYLGRLNAFFFVRS